MHDAQLYDESVRVPLLLRLPRGEMAGTVVPEAVSLVDVAPTLAAVAQVALAGTQGRSLLETARDVASGASGDDEPVFFGAERGMAGARLGRFKLVRHAEKLELYDVETDRAERVDLAAQRPEVVRSLAQLLEERDAADRAVAATHTRGAITISEAERNKMGALGYQ